MVRTPLKLYGMPYTPLTLDTATERALSFARAGRPMLVTTPNTDHFLRWQKDLAFRRLYSRSSMSILDGMPLVWIARLLGQPAARVTGIDLFSSLCAAAEIDHVPVAIVGGRNGAADRAAAALRSRFPEIEIAYTHEPTDQELTAPDYCHDLADRLKHHSAIIVALCLGSPKQEILFQDLAKHAPPGVYLGVGAAVDFWSGDVMRAPVFLQRVGLEWLFRLSREPLRLWRRYLVDDLPILGYLVAATITRAGRSLKGLITR